MFLKIGIVVLDDQLLGACPLSTIRFKKDVSHVVVIEQSSFSFQKSAGISSGPGDLPFFIAFFALMTSGAVIRGIGPTINLFSGIGG